MEEQIISGLVATKNQRKLDHYKMVEPHATKTTTRSDRSGYIWDYAEISLNITETQQKELEKTWCEIPKNIHNTLKN